MLTKEQRPITAVERQIVQAALVDTSRSEGCRDRSVALFYGFIGSFLLGGLLTFLLIAICSLLARMLHKVDLASTTGHILMCIGGCVGSILSVRVLYQNDQETRRCARKTRLTYEQDLEAGKAEIWHCEVSRVVQLEEEEDDSFGFFLELAPDQTLFLEGRYFYKYLHGDHEDKYDEINPDSQNHSGVWPPAPRLDAFPDKRGFPCCRFDLVYAPNSRMLLDLVPLGERFEKWPTYIPDWKTVCKVNRNLDDGDVLPISLDALDVDLARWAAQQNHTIR